ncbi:RNA-binding protein pop5 [Rhizina undulata]
MVRFKSRYLLFNVLYPDAAPAMLSSKLDFATPSEASLNAGDISRLVRESIALNFGDWGAGVTGNLSVKYFSPTTSTGIIRVSREHFRVLWASLTFIREIRNRPAVVRVVRVSGTIKKAEMEAIKRDELDIGKVQAAVRVEDNEDEDMDMD